MPDSPVLIFDLDGTILGINSYPHWVRHMLHGSLSGLPLHRRTLLSWHTGMALLRRKLLKGSHHAMKSRLQFLWSDTLGSNTDIAAREFAVILKRHIRPNFLLLLSQLETNERPALLATAAAGEYALALGKTLGFRHVLATPLYAEGGCENVGEEKRNRTLAYLQANGLQDRDRLFFTDHEEDLPMIRECRRVAWLGSDAMLETVRKAAPEVEIIPCCDWSAEQMLSLLVPTAIGLEKI